MGKSLFCSVLVLAVLGTVGEARAQAVDTWLASKTAQASATALNAVWGTNMTAAQVGALGEDMLLLSRVGVAAGGADVTAAGAAGGAVVAMTTPAGWVYGAITGGALLYAEKEYFAKALALSNPPEGLDPPRFEAVGTYGRLVLPVSIHVDQTVWTDFWACRIAAEGENAGANATTAATLYPSMYSAQGIRLATAPPPTDLCVTRAVPSGMVKWSQPNLEQTYVLTGAFAHETFDCYAHYSGNTVNSSTVYKFEHLQQFVPKQLDTAGKVAYLDAMQPEDDAVMIAPFGAKLDQDGDQRANPSTQGGRLSVTADPPAAGTTIVYVDPVDGLVHHYTAGTEPGTEHPPGDGVTPTPTPAPTPTPVPTPVPTPTPTATPWGASAEPSSNPEATPSVVPTPPVALTPGPVSSENFVTHPITVLRGKFPFDWTADAVVGLPDEQDMYWVAWEGQTIEGHPVERTYDLNWTKPIWRAIAVVGVIGLCVTAFLLL